jgi:glucan phosphoethanolaminetransferase (alkaline phosphatase superfamily)
MTWREVVRTDQSEGIILLSWYLFILAATCALLFKLCHGWIQKPWIRNRLTFLSFFSVLSLISGVILMFAIPNRIFMIIVIGLQMALFDWCIYTQMDILQSN